jgi:general secretion pathway protein K
MVTPRHDPRAGYVLLAMLWICAGIGALTWLISVSAREAMATSRNRMSLTAGSWQAQACLALSRQRLRDALSQQVPDVWQHVDRVLKEDAPLGGCTLSARVVGARLDVNKTDEATLARALQATGLPQARADSAAAALADWMDADNQTRPGGAERDWYLAQGREPPSNGPFVDRRELRRVRGLEDFARVDSIVDIEPGALALNVTPRVLLSLLPGFTDRTLREILDARARGESVTTFAELSHWLDPHEPDASAKLPGMILLTPEAWILTVRSRTGTPPVTTVLEVRLTHSNQTTVVTRRRSWIE